MNDIDFIYNASIVKLIGGKEVGNIDKKISGGGREGEEQLFKGSLKQM